MEQAKQIQLIDVLNEQIEEDSNFNAHLLRISKVS
jgi:hypothetical protein